MRSFIATAFLAASALAGPIVERAVDVSSPCAAQPAGSGPAVTSPADDAASFLSYSTFHTQATGATTPSGYTKVFTNLNASVIISGSYLGYYMLGGYDPLGCSQVCNQVTGCLAMNVFVERDPTVMPATGCLNPPSQSNYICTLYSNTLAVQTPTATNAGQMRGNFSVVISGSNGYVKTTGIISTGI